MDDNTFAHHFRLTKPQFEYLLMKLQDKCIKNEDCQGLPPVPVTKKMLMFLANQNSFREMSYKVDVSLIST